MGFGMMAGKPSKTMGGKNAMPPTNEKMPNGKQSAPYKKPAPSNAGIPSVKIGRAHV